MYQKLPVTHSHIVGLKHGLGKDKECQVEEEEEEEGDAYCMKEDSSKEGVQNDVTVIVTIPPSSPDCFEEQHLRRGRGEGEERRGRGEERERKRERKRREGEERRSAAEV